MFYYSFNQQYLPDWVNSWFPTISFMLGNTMPLESQAPVKATNHWFSGLHVKCKSVPIDGINNWT